MARCDCQVQLGAGGGSPDSTGKGWTRTDIGIASASSRGPRSVGPSETRG